MLFYRKKHSSIFLHIRWLHNIVSTDEVVLNVVLIKRAEETVTSQAPILELLPIGQGAQAGLREGLAHGPAALLRGPRGLQHRPELIREGKRPSRAAGLGVLGDQVKFGFPAATDVVELLNALVDQGWRRLLVRHGHPAAEEHLELLGERVIKLRGAVQLLLAGDPPGVADGADDLGHLPREEGVLFGTRSGGHSRAQGANTKLSPGSAAHSFTGQPRRVPQESAHSFPGTCLIVRVPNFQKKKSALPWVQNTRLSQGRDEESYIIKA